MIVEDRYRYEPVRDQFHHQRVREDVLAKSDARRTPRNFLEQQQNRFALFGRERQGAIVIAQPRDVAELTMLAKGNSVILHSHNMARRVRKTIR